MLETLEREWERKLSKVVSLVVWGGLVCARKDSRPLEKAKEPRGRAESESKRRVWRDVVVAFIGFVWVR